MALYTPNKKCNNRPTTKHSCTIIERYRSTSKKELKEIVSMNFLGSIVAIRRALLSTCPSSRVHCTSSIAIRQRRAFSWISTFLWSLIILRCKTILISSCLGSRLLSATITSTTIMQTLWCLQSRSRVKLAHSILWAEPTRPSVKINSRATAAKSKDSCAASPTTSITIILSTTLVTHKRPLYASSILSRFSQCDCRKLLIKRAQ